MAFKIVTHCVDFWFQVFEMKSISLIDTWSYVSVLDNVVEFVINIAMIQYYKCIYIKKIIIFILQNIGRLMNLVNVEIVYTRLPVLGI